MTIKDVSLKLKTYVFLVKNVTSIIENEPDLTANLANISALIYEVFDFLWVGFYRVKNQELVLGPFQGPLACTRIAKGRGVCGTAWVKNEVLIIPDVEDFPGHISCNPAAKSEIVLPAVNNKGAVFLVLDIDSKRIDDFDAVDKQGLSKIIELIEHKHG